MSKLGKFLVLLNKPKDTNVLKHAMKFVNYALQPSADDDTKIALPMLLKGIVSLYASENTQVVPMLYQMKISKYIQRELELGRKQPTTQSSKDHKKSLLSSNTEFR